MGGIKTEIRVVNSERGNDSKAIDLSDTVTVSNIIDGKEKISKNVKVEWLFGSGSNYFLDQSVPDQKRLEMIVGVAKQQKAPYTISQEVLGYINRLKSTTSDTKGSL